MKAKAQLSSYEEVEFSIRLTATVSDWRAMMKQLEKLSGEGNWLGWPLSSLSGCINKMLSDLDKTHADAVVKEDQASFLTSGQR